MTTTPSELRMQSRVSAIVDWMKAEFQTVYQERMGPGTENRLSNFVEEIISEAMREAVEQFVHEESHGEPLPRAGEEQR